MAIIPTVRIKHVGFPGGVLINADAFDPKVHQLFDDKPHKAEAKAESDDDADGSGGKKGKK